MTDCCFAFDMTVLLSPTQSYTVLLSPTQSYSVLLSPTQSYSLIATASIFIFHSFGQKLFVFSTISVNI